MCPAVLGVPVGQRTHGLGSLPSQSCCLQMERSKISKQMIEKMTNGAQVVSGELKQGR